MNEIQKGTKVKVCGKRLGIVESDCRYVVSGEITSYYVRWLKKDGSPSLKASWCHPANVQPA